jgi:hypothetical protein
LFLYFLRAIKKNGLAKWKEDNNYHKRSLVETAFFRYKTIFGGNLRSRRFENQVTESLIKCMAWNKMIKDMMPDSYIAS